MRKTILSFVAVMLIFATITGCSAPKGKSVAAADKTPVLLPESLFPQGVSYSYDDDNKSSAYYEAVMTEDEVKDFYKKAFTDMGAYDLLELDEKQMREKGIVPEGEKDSTGDIVWAYYGKYTISSEEAAAEGAKPDTVGHLAVICSRSGDKVGVEVAIAYRALNIGKAFGFVPIEDEK